MNAPRSSSTERSISTANGWPMLFLVIFGFLAAGLWLLSGFAAPKASVLQIIAAALIIVGLIVCNKGFFTLQPNEACVLLLFGSYRGTERRAGFHWTNPFYSRLPISLRS